MPPTNQPQNNPSPAIPPSNNQAPAPISTPPGTPTNVPPAPNLPGQSIPSTGSAPTPNIPKPKSPILKILVIIIVIAILGVGGWYAYTKYFKKAPAGNKSSSAAESSSSAAIADNCGVTLVISSPENPDWPKVVDASAIPEGLTMHNTGDQDSVTEFCEAKKMREQAEAFLTSLSENNFDKAYTFLSAKDMKDVPLATKKANWTVEYGAYDFPPSKYPVNQPGELPTYSIEQCKTDLPKGWSKNIVNANYNTPLLTLATNVSTIINLGLTKESGIWKISGENNALGDAKKILDGDAFSNGQDSRVIDPNKC